MHNFTAYTIFWLPSGYHFEEPFSSGTAEDTQDQGYVDLVNRFFQDVGGTPFMNILTQYSDTSGQVANAATLGGTFTDTSTALNQYNSNDTGSGTNPLLDYYDPGATTPGDLQQEIQHVITTEGWPSGGMDVEFFLFTPAGVQSCFTSAMTDCSVDSPQNGAFCAYHSVSYPDGVTPRIYSNMFDAGDATRCGTGLGGNGPNNDEIADYEISPIMHEMFESISDPIPDSGWFDKSNANIDGGEIGDHCAYIYGTPDTNGGNVIMHGDEYLIQEMFSNASDNSCVTSFSRPSTLTVNTASDPANTTDSTPLCPYTAGGDPADQGGTTVYSLRCAIGDADNDALAGASVTHTINFSGCPCSITTSSQLPDLADPGLTLNGGGNVSLDGGGNIPTGLNIDASHVSVAGLTVSNFTADGIDVVSNGGAPSTSVIIGGDGSTTQITGNGGYGVQVGSSNTDNSKAIIDPTVINGNTSGGIALNGLSSSNCATASNTPGENPNDYLNCPVITTASSTSNIVSGSSSCSSGHACTVEVFSVPTTADSSGHGQAQTFLGSATTTSGGAWSLTPSPALSSSETVTATLTDTTAGETSEFAANFIASSSGTVVTASSSTVTYGQGDVSTTYWTSPSTLCQSGAPNAYCKPRLVSSGITCSYGGAPTPSILATGLTDAPPGASVGNYTTYCWGAYNPGTSFSYVAGTLAIRPASLTIHAVRASVIRGQSLPQLIWKANFVNHDTASSLTRQPRCRANVKTNRKGQVISRPGTYSITCSGAKDPNYRIHYHTQKLIVSSARRASSF